MNPQRPPNATQHKRIKRLTFRLFPQEFRAEHFAGNAEVVLLQLKGTVVHGAAVGVAVDLLNDDAGDSTARVRREPLGRLPLSSLLRIVHVDLVQLVRHPLDQNCRENRERNFNDGDVRQIMKSCKTKHVDDATQQRYTQRP